MNRLSNRRESRGPKPQDEARGRNMPRTKKQTSGHHSDPLPEANGLAGEVFTLAEAAVSLRANEADIIGLIHSQGLPGQLIAGEWWFLKDAIQQWLSASGPM